MLAICRLHVVFEHDAQRDASWRSEGFTTVVLVRHALAEHDLDRHHLMWAVGECCRNGLCRAPFFTLCGSQSSAASLQSDDLAGLGKADGNRIRRPAAAVNHRGFVRLPDQHLGLSAKRSMFSMHTQCTLACCHWYDATRDDRASGRLHRWYEGPFLVVPAAVKTLLSFL